MRKLWHWASAKWSEREWSEVYRRASPHLLIEDLTSIRYMGPARAKALREAVSAILNDVPAHINAKVDERLQIFYRAQAKGKTT